MPRRASKKKEDFAEMAFRVLQEAIGEREKTLPLAPRPKPNPETVRAAAAALSALGASKGAYARPASMTRGERQTIARKAAAASRKARRREKR